MLVLHLKEKTGEFIDVDGPCRVTVTKTRGKQVYLGIDAARHVRVVRSNAKKRTPRKEPAAT